MFETLVTEGADDGLREDRYRAIERRLAATLEDESDWTAAMATAVAMLHEGFDYFDWTGFYRHVEPEVLVVGPYQGSSGCLRIPFSMGICGAAARTEETQFVPDVEARTDHIACSASTEAEVVVPVAAAGGGVAAVLDVDSDIRSVFGAPDRRGLESIAGWLADAFEPQSPN